MSTKNAKIIHIYSTRGKEFESKLEKAVAYAQDRGRCLVEIQYRPTVDSWNALVVYEEAPY